MRLVIDSHVMANAFLSEEQPKYKLLLNELVQALEARASASGKSGKGNNDGLSEFEVFISYNHVDGLDAQDIAGCLESRNIKPWLDKKRLKGGNDSEYEIRQAINRVSLFLFCISNASFDREGWHYKEYKLALDRQDKHPEGRTFIIPVKLTREVDLPPSISLIQAVELYAQDGWDQLIEAVTSKDKKNGTLEGESLDDELFLYQDKRAQIFERYSELLPSQSERDEFNGWFEGLQRYHNLIKSVDADNRLMPVHKQALDKFSCRQPSDEIFIKVAKNARAVLVSDGGNADQCRNGHPPSDCVLDYLRNTMCLPHLPVDRAVKELQELKRKWENAA